MGCDIRRCKSFTRAVTVACKRLVDRFFRGSEKTISKKGKFLLSRQDIKIINKERLSFEYWNSHHCNVRSATVHSHVWTMVVSCSQWFLDLNFEMSKFAYCICEMIFFPSPFEKSDQLEAQLTFVKYIHSSAKELSLFFFRFCFWLSLWKQKCSTFQKLHNKICSCHVKPWNQWPRKRHRIIVI